MPQVILISLTCHMLTNDDTETIYSWPGTRFRSGEKVGVKQKNKNEKKLGTHSEPSGWLGRGKGPYSPSPDSSSVRFARPFFFSLFPPAEPVATSTVQRNMTQWDTPQVVQSNIYSLWLQSIWPSPLPIIGTYRSDDGDSNEKVKQENKVKK